MVKLVAGLIAKPLWHEAMAYALSKYPKTYFGEPSPIFSSVPPMLRGDWQVPDINGNSVPHSLLYWTDKNNPQGPPPADPTQDSQFAYWEHGVSAWYASHPNLFSGGIMLPIPLTYVPTATTTPSDPY